MTWIDRLLRRSSAIGTDFSFPVDVDIVPGLSVHLYLHRIEHHGLACWSYITDGLRSKGQKELVFTLRCEPGESAHQFPRDPLDVLVSINSLAEQGRLVDVGDVSQFARTKLFGRHLAYIDAEFFPGVAVPPQALGAILVTDDEIEAVKEFGILRLMSRLGFASRHFPCPPWSDRSRDGISFRKTRQHTMLTHVLNGRAPGVRVVHSGHATTLRIDPDAIAHVQTVLAGLSADEAVALFTDIDSIANGCLVWEPGQSRPEAITRPNSDGSRLCGCFVMLVPQQQENEVRLVEDGVALMLTDDAWADVRKALTQPAVTISLACRDGHQILVEQVPA